MQTLAIDELRAQQLSDEQRIGSVKFPNSLKIEENHDEKNCWKEPVKTTKKNHEEEPLRRVRMHQQSSCDQSELIEREEKATA